MEAVLRAAALGALRGADLDLVAGRYVVLSNEPGPLQDLVSVLAGFQAPTSGYFLLGGVAPSASPVLRRKLAALLASESLPPATDVTQSVAKALVARGESAAQSPARAAELLAEAGLTLLGARPPRALDARETRSVALALALAHDTAELLSLHEPLATLLPTDYVLAGLDRHSARGAIVLCTSTSVADATALGGRWLCAELGRVRLDAAQPRLGAGPWQRVQVETPDARALSQLLYEAEHGLITELGGSAQALHVTGPALDVTVREVLRIARAHGIELTRIEAAPPPVEALLAARAGFARGAYEAARGAAHFVPPAPSWRAPGGQ